MKVNGWCELLVSLRGQCFFFMLIYAYFGSHFYFGSVVANVPVGGLSVQAAEEKIQQETKQVEIKLKGEYQTIKLQVASPYKIQKDYLKKNIRRGEFSLPIKKGAKDRLAEAINRASFLGEKKRKMPKSFIPIKNSRSSQKKTVQW